MGVYTSGFTDSREVVAGWQPKFEASFAGSWARRVAWLNPDAVHETEIYRWFGGAPPMRQWIGKRQEKTLGKYEYQLTNVKYEDTLPIPLDDLRRDKTGGLALRARE